MRLFGKRILLVEDEPVVAMLAEDLLTDLGCVVVGPAVRLKEGLALVERERLDLALLDINLGADTSFPIAAALSERQIPFAFATGYGALAHPFDDAPVISKPYTSDDLRLLLEGLLS
jgi:CheY-like chemotaxis protein